MKCVPDEAGPPRQYTFGIFDVLPTKQTIPSPIYLLKVRIETPLIELAVIVFKLPLLTFCLRVFQRDYSPE